MILSTGTSSFGDDDEANFFTGAGQPVSSIETADLVTMRWGLVPPWAESPDRGPPPINARAETLLTRRVFADAMRSGHRCLVPVSGFFEFKASSEGKQPVPADDATRLTARDGWAVEPLVSGRRRAVGHLHDHHHHVRQRRCGPTPRSDAGSAGAGALGLVARPTQPGHWRLSALFAPSTPGSLVGRQVSRRVNDARNDDPTLLSA